jgi:hypothetical protein
VYLTKRYGDYCIMQANSSMRRSNTWSLTFKGGGKDCGVNNHGAGAEMTGDLVKCNIGILHKQAPTVGPRMQYFWYLYSSTRDGDQYAIPYYGYNTGADGTKLFDVTWQNYIKTNVYPAPDQLKDEIEWSDGDTFGISYDADQNIIFTHNGNVIHTRDASEEYVSTEGATSQVAFSSHWHLQGTPVYDLSFSALI